MATATGSPTTDSPRAPEAQRALAGARPARSQTLVTVVALAIAAGVIHAVAMVDHFDHHWLYGVFFLVVTYAQILWGIWLYRHPRDRRALAAGAVGSLAVVSVWVVSRTIGVPVGPDRWNPERIGAMDIMATFDQLAAALLVVLLIAPASRVGVRLRWVVVGGHDVRLGIMLCSASAFALILGSHAHP